MAMNGMSTRTRKAMWVGIAVAVVCSTCGAANPDPNAIQAAPVVFDPQPWLDDLEEARIAFSTRYAGLEWEVFGRDHDINASFATARERILHAHDDRDAQAAFVRLMSSFGDRHVQISWPGPSAAGEAQAAKGFSCETLGYTKRMQAGPLVALLPGYKPLEPPGNVFPIGTLLRRGRTIGVIKIPIFTSRGFPALCESAIQSLKIDATKECDEACQEKIGVWGDSRMTEQLEAAVKAVERAGATTLVVDIAGNGGGSEWEGAASRMLTPIRLEAIRNYFMRGALWTRHWVRLEGELRDAERKARGEDKEFLGHFVEMVEERKKEAETPCDASPLWEGKHPACAFLGDAFFTTGFLSSADPETLRAKPWASLVFNPMQYPYHEGVWRGPLVVVVDGGTGSAAENFAADLQDNRAAVIIGSPTVGAGCGHTDGGAPTKLTHTGGIFNLPDCLRVRRNGDNLSFGVRPDILVGLRGSDPPKHQAFLLDQKLDDALRAVQDVQNTARE
jgi:Peptidase family S41